LFDPNTPDAVFSADFNRRYGNNTGDKLLEAYALSSRMPLRLASFHSATWDYTLSSEGFLAPVQNGFNDNASPFISIDELIEHRTLDPMYLSIPDYVESKIHRGTWKSHVVLRRSLHQAKVWRHGNRTGS
jgi:hypothetical protein